MKKIIAQIVAGITSITSIVSVVLTFTLKSEDIYKFLIVIFSIIVALIIVVLIVWVLATSKRTKKLIKLLKNYH